MTEKQRAEFIFLSTPSARRATLGLALQKNVLIDFYPRPPRGGRHVDPFRRGGCRGISIHALREEGDFVHGHLHRVRYDFYPRPPRGGRLRSWPPAPGEIRFLSTPSARRATSDSPASWQSCCISIHALREEGDSNRILLTGSLSDFYPRPPRGGRLG